LAQFFQIQSRYQEGADAFGAAARRLLDGPDGHGAPAEPAEPAETEAALLVLLSQLGRFYVRLGRLEEAEAAFTRCDALFRRLGWPFVPGFGTDPRIGLGQIATLRGDHATATRLVEEACRLSDAQHHPWNGAYSYNFLSILALHQGDPEQNFDQNLDQAQRYAQHAYALTQEAGDRWCMALCLNQLGNVACARREYGAASQYFEAQHTIQEAFADAGEQAAAVNCLAQVAFLRGDYPEAQRLYRRSRAAYEAIADHGGAVTSIVGLGNVACALGEHDAARRHLRAALRIASERSFVPTICAVCVGVGDLLLRTEREDEARTLLVAALRHPAGTYQTRERARELLDGGNSGPTALAMPAGVSGAGHDLAAVVRRLLDEAPSPARAALGDARPAQKGGDDQKRPLPTAGLIEPLTARELEVLRLAAVGRSNRQIAAALVIAEGTVKAHLHNICGKLGAANRVEAVVRATALRLV
ncbi:MAG: tetratricopeptide repeat protein, partial [Chloroflexota bacterium]